MLEASVHPVILLGKLNDLLLKKRIHAACVDHIAPRWEVRERLENRQLIPLIVREHLSHERNNPRELSTPWSMSAASMTGLPERNNATIFLALVARSIISAPNRPRCRLASAHRAVLDIRVYSEATGRRVE